MNQYKTSSLFEKDIEPPSKIISTWGTLLIVAFMVTFFIFLNLGSYEISIPAKFLSATNFQTTGSQFVNYRIFLQDKHVNRNDILIFKPKGNTSISFKITDLKYNIDGKSAIFHGEALSKKLSMDDIVNRDCTLYQKIHFFKLFFKLK